MFSIDTLTGSERRDELSKKADRLLKQIEPIEKTDWWILTEYFFHINTQSRFMPEWERKMLINLVEEYDIVLTHCEDFYTSMSRLIVPKLQLNDVLVNMLAKIQNRERRFIVFMAYGIYFMNEANRRRGENSVTLNMLEKYYNRISNIAKRSPYGIRYDWLNRNEFSDILYSSPDGAELALGDFFALNISQDSEEIKMLMQLSVLCRSRLKWELNAKYREATVEKNIDYANFAINRSRNAKKSTSFLVYMRGEFDERNLGY